MIFTLEALQAGKGDSLVLHYGNPKAPRFLVIDGGPDGIYRDSLRPRLEELWNKWQDKDDEKLHLEMVMVSHIDDDHINGILEWMDDIANDSAVPCNIATLWYNSFDSILNNTADELRSRVASLADQVAGSGEQNGGPLGLLAAKVITSSVAQGRELRRQATALGIGMNDGFEGGLVMSKADGCLTITRPGGLKLHVIGPGRKRLEALLKEWNEHVKKHPDPVVVASFADRSVANLSSIVVVAELGGKRMLLTGDARGDDVYSGLEAAGFLDNEGNAHFDLIKMPHHGSDRNMTLKWLQQITADHYVISANGEHGNPDPPVIEWICNARGDAEYSIHITNEVLVDPKTGVDVGSKVRQTLADNPGSQRRVVYRKPQDGGVLVNLAEKSDLLKQICVVSFRAP